MVTDILPFCFQLLVLVNSIERDRLSISQLAFDIKTDVISGVEDLDIPGEYVALFCAIIAIQKLICWIVTGGAISEELFYDRK